MDRKQLLTSIKQSLETKIWVTNVYLFGSRATGVYYQDSDYDIAVVSDDFEELSFIERQQLVKPLIRNVLGDKPLDVACYTEAEFEEGKKAALPQLIEKEGIKV